MERKINYPKEFPILASERLLLSKMTLNDSHDLFRIRSSKDFTEYLSSDPYKEEEQAREVIRINEAAYKNKDGLSWKISYLNESKLIGYIGFWRNDFSNFRAEVGFGLDKEHRNKGIMSEALKLVVDFGFNSLNLHSIMADTDPMNKASIKVLEGAGFKREAHIKENYYYKGKFYDSYYYGILENEFIEQK